MTDEEIDFRKSPLPKEAEEGRQGRKKGTDCPYDDETQSAQHISWWAGWEQQADFECLRDMGR